MRKKLTEQLKRTFRPEFINRVDSIIVFRQLTPSDIRQIVDIILEEVNDRLHEHELHLQASDGAKDWLVENGYDRDFGARPLRRLIQSTVEDRLSDAVLSGKFNDGDEILVDVEDDEIVLRHVEEQSPDEIEEEALPAA
jgi:ATP-dependent Clp protease ATP-binding subunit ClpC